MIGSISEGTILVLAAGRGKIDLAPLRQHFQDFRLSSLREETRCGHRYAIRCSVGALTPTTENYSVCTDAIVQPSARPRS